ncbi:MAG TPA: flagellar biosynthesis protein FlgH, partial [Erythrobacter sp.]|nr:flagellar biosynthesis protein FlgH [Erythrobacter sp.]
MKTAICLLPLSFALAACGGGSARPAGFAAALPPPPQAAPVRHRDGAIYQASQ